MREPFERVVGRHGPTVLRVCRALLGPDDAQDAWSETFLSALRAYPQLPDDANVEAWLVTIAHRKAVDATRAARRRPVPVADPAATSAGTGRRHEAATDAATDLYQALAALPVRQRQAVAYHHLAGLAHAEIARILGGSPQASRRAVADGMATLRRRLAPHDQTGPRPAQTAGGAS